MTKLIQIAQGIVNARLHAGRDEKLIAQRLLSFKLDGAAAAGRSAGEWDGRSSLFEFESGVFPAGFVTRLYREFKALGYTVQIHAKPLPGALGVLNPKVDDFPEDPRYDYQGQIPGLLERYGKIIAQVATGGGKSRIAKLCTMRIKRPTLFLTTRAILAHQMRDAFIKDLKQQVNIYGDGEWGGPHPTLFNVGMVQTFAAWLEEPDPRLLATPEGKAEHKKQLGRRAQAIALLGQFEFVILEEAHEASSDSYYDILRHCVSAAYRLALTGTPFMKDSELANLKLEGSSGPIAIKVSEQLLIERGILARPYFKFIDIADPYPKGLFIHEVTKKEVEAILTNSASFQRAYEIGIAGGIKRNMAIVNEVVGASLYGLKSMVLVQHQVHGHRLARMLDDAGIKCIFIWGEKNQKERQAALQALRDGRIQCLIGSTILDVGVDVPAVGLVVLAGAGKAEVAVRQRIGRGLREKKDGSPNVCLVVDFTDRINGHLRSHARERRAMIEATPGFVEGIVPTFNMAALGFKLLEPAPV